MDERSLQSSQYHQARVPAAVQLAAAVDGAYSIKGAHSTAVETNEVVADVAVRHTATLVDAHRAELTQIRNNGDCVDGVDGADVLKTSVNGQNHLVLRQNKVWHRSKNSKSRIRPTSDQALIARAKVQLKTGNFVVEIPPISATEGDFGKIATSSGGFGERLSSYTTRCTFHQTSGAILRR